MRKAILLKKLYKRCKEKTERKSSYLLLLFLFISLNAFPKGYSQVKLTLNFKNTELKKIISFIEKRTDYRFLYQTSEVDLQKKVDISYKGNVSNAISMLFNDSSVYPVIMNKQIILKPKVNFQEKVISGIVTDEQGIPISDVTVLINRGQRDTVTDVNGKYSISGKSGDKISFIFIGFKEQELIIGKNNTINIVLKEDINFLDEVILVGYGKAEKSKISTAIGTIKGENIQNELQSGGSFDRSLGGMVKGLKITQGGGRPGSGVDINIRGYTSPFSNSANNPLFVIDGVPIQAKKSFSAGTGYNPLTSINPNDIESVNVLKDAAATSIYGSRGANGVIIIKTKKGSVGEDVTVDLSVRSTFSKPINTLKYLDTEGYKKYIDALMTSAIKEESSLRGTNNYGEISKFLRNHYNFGIYTDNNGNPAYDPSLIKYGSANTNWSDVVYRKAAHTKEYNVSVRGSLEHIDYGLSLRYLDQEGLLKADSFEQYNTRLNLSFLPNEKWELGTNINLGLTNNKTGYVSMRGNNPNSILNVRPDLAVYDEKGNLTSEEKPSGYGDFFNKNVVNPLGQTTKHSGISKDKTVTGNMYVQYEVLSGLKLKTALNVSHFISNSSRFRNKLYTYGGLYVLTPDAIAMPPMPGFDPYEELKNLNNEIALSNLTESSSINTNVVLDFTANYVKTFNKKHGLDVLAGVTRTREYSKFKRNEYEGFDFANLAYPQYAKKQRLPLSNFESDGLNSYIGRVMYDYDNKYNLTATVRLDQSSRFSPLNRDAWFPSVSASWNIHNESFMDFKKINQLKLRLSYGNTGSTNVPFFAFIQKFTAKDIYNGGTSIGISNQLANPFVGWEKTSEVNLGLDFGVLTNRISGSVDVYKRRTTGALMPSPYNLDTGTSNYTANFATIDNKGIELDLNVGIIETKDFHWSLGLNATKNINKLISFDESSISSLDIENYEVGKEINLIKGYVVEGIYQSPEEIKKADDEAKQKGHKRYNERAQLPSLPGDYKYKDISGPNGKPDGKIDKHDLQILGSSQPDLYGGFRTNFRYNGISLGASFNYSLGAESTRTPMGLPSPYANIEEQFAPKYRWSPENPDAKLSRVAVLSNDILKSSADVYDASYLRLKSVRLGYNLPFSVVEKLHIKSVNLYISGNNLYTWTKFPGLDPEGTAGGAFTNSVQNTDPYPISKSWTLGVNVKF